MSLFSTICEPTALKHSFVPADLLKVLLSRGGLVNVAEGAVVCAVGAVGTVPGVVAVDPR